MFNPQDFNLQKLIIFPFWIVSSHDVPILLVVFPFVSHVFPTFVLPDFPISLGQNSHTIPTWGPGAPGFGGIVTPIHCCPSEPGMGDIIFVQRTTIISIFNHVFNYIYYHHILLWSFHINIYIITYIYRLYIGILLKNNNGRILIIIIYI